MTNQPRCERRDDRGNCFRAATVGFLVCLWQSADAAPTLAPGVWTNITPPALVGANNLYTLTIDPSNPDVLYLPSSFMADAKGLWKSTDRGSTWTQLGNPSAPRTTDTLGDHVGFLDSPFRIEVDPANPRRIYATDLSPGGSQTIGFWISLDGGSTWLMPKGEKDACVSVGAPTDISGLSVDPTNFNHLLISFHYWWSNSPGSASGFFESNDGGMTWTILYPNSGMDGGASRCITFLYNPALGIGDAKTWLMGCDGSSYWRTSNGGASWTKVSPSTVWANHGGNTYVHYSKTGVLYCGAAPYLMRSTDNGITWTVLSSNGLGYGWYASAAGDGATLYAATLDGTHTWYTSPETDGLHWTAYTSPSLPSEGAYLMRFDSVNHIMYSANEGGGLWAMKLPETTVSQQTPSAASRLLAAKSSIRIGTTGIAVQSSSGRLFDVKGRMMPGAGGRATRNVGF